MKRYQQGLQELNRAEADLSAKRREYGDSRSSRLGNEIRQAEIKIEKTRTEISRLRSEVHKALR